MAETLRLAERGRLTADPNPAVGCVIVSEDAIVGRGFHRAAGEAHAEVHALREAGARARGATAYVSLEPCCHHGRTPPCVEALISAGVTEVVAAMVDPFPANAGQGLEQLARAGVTVRSGLMESAARALNAGFVSRIERSRPWVRLKLAISLDGRTAGPDGRSQWITSQAAREDVQRWRARASAIMTGIGTVLADDPRLNLRLAGVERLPARVVVDSQARTPESARLLSLAGRVLLATTRSDPPWSREGAEWLTLPAGPDGRVDLTELMRELARQAINEVHVEAGPGLSGALLEAGLVDEILVYQASVLLGAGSPMLGLTALEKFEQRHHLQLVQERRVGRDWRLRFAATAPTGSAGQPVGL